MRAIVYDRFGPPDVLALREVPAAPCGLGEVRVRVHAAALNPKDSFVRKGRFRLFSGARFPRRIGHDLAGVVEEAGPGADLSRGDRVFAMISSWAAGALAEEAVLPARECARLPPGLGFEEAAALPLVCLTALQALRDVARVRGGTVLVLGASGGVGLHAVQIARLLGAQVVTTSSAANLDLCRRAGAAEALDYAVDDPRAHDGRPRTYDAILDAFGNKSLAWAQPALAPGATFVTTVPSRRIALDALLTLFASRRARPVAVRPRRADLDQIAAWASAGSLRAFIDQVVGPEQVQEAFRRLESKRTRGKLVVRFA